MPEDHPANQAEDPSAISSSGSLQRAESRSARRIVILLGLLLIGLATGIWAIALFPSRPQLLTPASFILGLGKGTKVNNIYVTIIPEGQSAEDIELSASTGSTPPSSQTGGFVTLVFPKRLIVKKCPSGAICRNDVANSFSVIEIPIVLGKNGATRDYDFAVTHAHFGFSSNGESAVADLPTVVREGSASSNEILQITYQVQDAATYDWSIPPLAVTADRVGWSEPLDVSSSSAFSEAPPSEITGINHAAEAQDNRDTFIAGILLGVAGGAAIAAVQEGLHLLFDDRNDGTPRKLRRIRTQSE